MRALDSMRGKMQAVGVYTLSGNTLVDKELEAYAQGFDTVYDALAELESESFAATASGYGLANLEQQFGIPSSGGEEERRSMILGLSAVTPKDSAKEAVQRAMNLAGFACELCENIASHKIYVNCLVQNVTDTIKKNAIKIAKLFLPAHLNAELDFRSISWNNIDQRDETFDQKDGMVLTWDSIDNYENALVEL